MRTYPLFLSCALLLGALDDVSQPGHGTATSQGVTAPRRISSAASLAPAVAAGHVDFAKQIQPILQARCQPCHFPGGKVYASMPFDRAETVLRLREKLFTRIKDEEQRKLIRAFLAEHPAPDTPARSGRPSSPSPQR
jgi:hypothetical protein